MLKDHVAHEPHVRWECRSVEYAQNTALFPLVELFQPHSPEFSGGEVQAHTDSLLK